MVHNRDHPLLTTASPNSLRRYSHVLVMQAARHPDRDQFARARDLWYRVMRLGRITPQTLVRPVGVIIFLNEFSKQTVQMTLTQHDDVVQQLRT